MLSLCVNGHGMALQILFLFVFNSKFESYVFKLPEYFIDIWTLLTLDTEKSNVEVITLDDST